MRNELKNIEIIELYLAEKLSVKERIDFENKINIDSKLYEEVQTQKSIQDRIALTAFKEDLFAFDTETTGAIPKKGFNLLSIVVLLLVFVASIGLFFKMNKKKQAKIDKQTKTIIATNTVAETESNFINLDSIQLYSDSLDLFAKNEDDIAKFFNCRNPKEPKRSKNNLLKELQVPFESAFINNQKGDTIVMKKSGSKIYILPNSIATKNGKLVEGKIEIRYREFRELPDIIFSKIPMTYRENEENFRFNSAGMFEIRAYKNGTELNIVPEKSIVVDYNITERLEDLNFYSLDNETQEWTFRNKINLPMQNFADESELLSSYVKDTCVMINKTPTYKGGFIEFNNYVKNHPMNILANEFGLKGNSSFNLVINTNGAVEKVVIDKKLFSKSTIIDTIVTLIFKDMKNFNTGIIANKKVSMPVSLNLNFSFKKNVTELKTLNKISRKKEKKNLKKEKQDFVKNMVKLDSLVMLYIKKDSNSFELNFSQNKKYEIEFVNKNDTSIYSVLIANNKFLYSGDSICMDTKDKKQMNDLVSNLITQNFNNDYFNAGHYFPKLIKGLKVISFGVFNCDQIKRVNKNIRISASYINEKGDTINPYFLSMIDLKYNASFSFSPTNFSFNPNSKNVLVLLEKDDDENDKIYIVNSESFKSIPKENNGTYVIKTEEFTDRIKKSSDLKEFLK